LPGLDIIKDDQNYICMVSKIKFITDQCRTNILKGTHESNKINNTLSTHKLIDAQAGEINWI